MTGALHGITIVDLSNWIAGPFGTMLLGDLGAEVIKIESPAGDGCRALGPPFQQDEAHFFMGVNRNKRDIVIDLKTVAGQDVVRDLAGIGALAAPVALGKVYDHDKPVD